MKDLLKSISLVLILSIAGNNVFAQSNEQKVFFGPGIGFDYGGIGGKIEYLPAKHFGLFGGLGYNLYKIGWNLGTTCKILPDEKVSPNLMVFYGYNAVSVVKGASQYDMTSYGVTIGANLDISVGRKGNKLSVGLFVPFRSEKFTDNYDAVKANPNIEITSELMPIGVSFGYNFKL